MSHPLLCECCGAATRKQCSKSSCLVPCWKSFIPWLLCGVAAALLPRELMPAVGHPRGGWGRPRCRHQGQECPGPLQFLSVVWESPLAGSRPSTGEKKPPFIPLKNCSTWREGWRGYLMCHCSMCSVLLINSRFSAAGGPSYLCFSLILSLTSIWLSLCNATWSYSLVGCFVSPIFPSIISLILRSATLQSQDGVAEGAVALITYLFV